MFWTAKPTECSSTNLRRAIVCQFVGFHFHEKMEERAMPSFREGKVNYIDAFGAKEYTRLRHKHPSNLRSFKVIIRQNNTHNHLNKLENESLPQR